MFSWIRSTGTTSASLAMDRIVLLAILICLTPVWGSPIQSEDLDQHELVDKHSDELDDVLSLLNDNEDDDSEWTQQVEPRAAPEDEPLETPLETEAESLHSENPDDSLTYAKRKLIRKIPKKKGKKQSKKTKKSKKGTRKLKGGRRGGRQLNLSAEDGVEKENDEETNETSEVAFEDRKIRVGPQEKRKRKKKRFQASKRCLTKRVKGGGNITDDDG